MAHFYSLTDTHGRLAKPKGIAGDKAAGLSTYAASWNGAAVSRLYHKDGRDYVRIELMPWSKAAHLTPGPRRLLYDGPVDDEAVTDTQALAQALLEAARAAEGAERA